MSDKTTSIEGWRVIVWAGVADIFVGFGLAVAGLADLFGSDMEFVALVGAVIAAVGLGIVIFGRNKLSQADNRRGDLN